jgi:hypothetical protein
MTNNSTSFVSKNGAITSITLDRAIEMAPAIAADRPADYISKRYNFTSTKDTISMMQDMGYLLTSAKQSNTKIALRNDYGAHIVTFQHPDLYIKDQDGNVEARPQVILSNSHDGSRPISFDMGVFRLVCSNGLMVKSQDLGSFKERHTKLNFDKVKQLVEEKIGSLPSTINTINSWVSREMSAKERQSFAEQALRLRVGEERQLEQYEINSLLDPKRSQDQGTNLWKVFNVCQENLTKGGFRMQDRQARAVTNPWADLTLNQGIWQIAESFAS